MMLLVAAVDPDTTHDVDADRVIREAERIVIRALAGERARLLRTRVVLPPSDRRLPRLLNLARGHQDRTGGRGSEPLTWARSPPARRR
jgi:hypothetical protein